MFAILLPSLPSIIEIRKFPTEKWQKVDTATTGDDLFVVVSFTS